jgi:DNA polymerase-3 subunit delta
LKRLPRVNPNVVIRNMKSGKILPLYMLCGEEEYLIETTLQKMIQVLLPDEKTRDFNLDLLEGGDLSAGEVIVAAETYPLAAPRRVIVLKNPSFLTGAKSDELNLLRKSVEQFRSDNLPRAAQYLARALGIPVEEITEGKRLQAAIARFRSENEDSLDREEIEFLDRAVEAFENVEVPSSHGGSDMERFLDWIRSGLSPTCVLILIVSGSISLRADLQEAIERAGIIINFEHLRSSYNLSRDPMFRAVSKHLAQFDKTISAEAFSLLRERCENDLGRVFEELEKLIPFVGDRSQIEESDVDRIVSEPISSRVFELTDAIGQRDASKALKALWRTLRSGEPPVKVHALITRQIRLIFQAKLIAQRGIIRGDVRMMDYKRFSETIYRNIPDMAVDLLPQSRQYNLLKQKPFPVFQALRLADNFTLQELRRAMERLFEADVALKTSQASPDLILEELVIDLCSPENLKGRRGRA